MNQTAKDRVKNLIPIIQAFWGIDQSYISETTVTEKSDGGEYWKLKFSNKCTGCAAKNDTSSSMDMQPCRVYSNKQAVREAIDNHIKILNIIKG